MKKRLTILSSALILVIAISYMWWNDDKIINIAPPLEIMTDDINLDWQPDDIVEIQDTAPKKSESNGIESNLIIDKTAGVEVTGWVKDQKGQGIMAMQIEISSIYSTETPKKTYNGVTDEVGKFVIPMVPSGNGYYLEVLASGNHSGHLTGSFVVYSNMPPITLALDSVELTSVDGMILGIDNTPVTGLEILVQIVGIAYPGQKVISDDSGFFHLNQFPMGELILSTDGQEHFKVTGLMLQPDEYRNLNVVLDKGSYHLSGWVSNEFDVPVSQARVALTSLFLRDDYESYSYRFVVTDSNGGFSFSGMGGLEHEISVDAIGYETQVQSYRFQSPADNLNIQLQKK